jgi:hypothetical protein
VQQTVEEIGEDLFAFGELVEGGLYFVLKVESLFLEFEQFLVVEGGSAVVDDLKDD